MKTKVKSSFGCRLIPAHGSLVFAMTLISSPLASAESGWWNTADGDWSNTANWWTTVGGLDNVTAVPTTGQTATLNGTGVNGDQTVYLDGARSVSSLTFANTGTSTLLGGTSGSPASNILTIGTSGITVNSGAGAVTIGGSGAVPITLGGIQTWTNNGTGALLINGNISNSTFGLTVTGPSHTTLNGTLGTGAGTLAKSGAGTLTLSGTNNFTGATTINGGTLALGNGGSLGATAITVGSGGTFAVAQNASSTSNSIGAAAFTLNAGSGLNMADTYTSTLNLGSTATLAPASGTSPSLTFDIGATTPATDLLAITGAATIGAARARISISPLTASITTGSPYTIISAASGLGANFSLATPVVIVTDGSVYALTLAQTAASVSVTAASNGLYWNGADSTLNTAANWNTTVSGGVASGSAPATASDLVFSITNSIPSNLTPTLGGNLGVNSVNFLSGAASVTVGSGNTLTINGGGITNLSGNSQALNPAITLGAAQTWTNNGAGALSIGGAITNGANGLTVTGTGNTNISSTISAGAGTLTKTGTGTLTLSGLGTTTGTNYSGATIIDQGTLAITTTNPAFTGGLTFGSGAGGPNVGTLDLSNASATFNGTLPVQTNSASANTITIGPGKTLTTNNNVTIGANGATGTNVVTKLNVTGASGTWNVVRSGGTFQLSAATSTNFDAPTLDMSGLGTFSANLGTTGTMRLGTQSGSGGDAGRATVILAANSTITANLLGIGDNGGSATNYTFGLGSGTNTLNVNTISVGQTSNSRGWGTLNFNTSTGSVKIRAADGTGRANLNLRVTTGGTNANVTHTFDVSGHSADLLLGTVNMMDIQQATNAANIYTSVFKFDTGTLDATAFKIGTRSDINANGTTLPAATVTIGDGVNNFTNSATLGAVTMATNSNTGAGSGIAGTLNITGSNTTVNMSSLTIANSSSASGSSAATGTVNISGGTVTNAAGILLASRTGSGTGTVSGTLNLTGGSLAVGGNITVAGTVTSNLTLNGGNLNMQGNAIGSGSGTITSNFQSGTLQALGELNGGGAFTKTTSGTLVMLGTNTYTGTTTVSGGTLLVNAPGGISGTGAVSVNGTLGGTGSVAGPVTVQSGGMIAPGTSTGTFTVASATFTASSTLAIEIDDASTPKADSLTSTGALDLTGANLVLAVTGSPAQPAYIIASYAAGQLTGTFTGLAQGAAVPGLSGYTIDYTYNSGTQIALVQSGAPAGFAAWIDDFGLVAADQDPGDDPDNDGIENLLEFAINGNPSISDPSSLPKLTVTATDFEFTYQRRDDSLAPETTQTFEWGISLATWPGSIIVPAASDVLGVATVSVTDGIPSNSVTDSVKISIPKTEAGAAAKLFGRLKVTKP
jgi:autotransporter-associated beta strand protein